MYLRWLLAVLALPLFAFTALPAQAATQTITATHTYVMGDNDSRNDARHLCFLEAKRKVLEQAGTFIQSSSEVKNFELTKDQITSYSAAILSVETIHESFDSRNGHNTLTLTVKANVDTDDTRKRLAAIASDGNLQKQIDEQQKKLQQLEEAIKRTNTGIASATPDQARDLRKERNVVFADIEDLEKIRMVAKERLVEEGNVECEIAKKMQRYVIEGMTKSEVSKILGNPFMDLGSRWIYGKSSVAFVEYKSGERLQSERVISFSPNSSCSHSK